MDWFSKKNNKKEEIVYFSVPVIATRPPNENDSKCNIWIHKNIDIKDVYFLSHIENDKSVWIKL